MSVYADKRNGKPTGKWVAEVQVDGKPRKKRVSTLEEAKKVEEQLRTLPSNLARAGANPKTLDQLIDLHGSRIWEGKTAWRVQAQSYARRMSAVLGQGKKIDRITGVDVIAIREHLEAAGLSRATVNRYLSVLHKALRYAARNGFSSTVPHFTWLKGQKTRLRWLSSSEELTLISYLEEREAWKVAAFVQVAIDTGARRGELLHPDTVVDGDWLRIQESKNGKPRAIPLTPRAKRLFPELKGLTTNAIRYHFEKVKVQMGLKDDRDFVIHTLRHTCATRMVQKNINLAIVQKWMGHSNIQTTLRYAHVADEDLKGALEQMEKAS